MNFISHIRFYYVIPNVPSNRCLSCGTNTYYVPSNRCLSSGTNTCTMCIQTGVYPVVQTCTMCLQTGVYHVVQTPSNRCLIDCSWWNVYHVPSNRYLSCAVLQTCIYHVPSNRCLPFSAKRVYHSKCVYHVLSNMCLPCGFKQAFISGQNRLLWNTCLKKHLSTCRCHICFISVC